MSLTLPVSLIPLPGIPLIAYGDDLGQILTDCARRADIVIEDRDVLVVAQKIVSKAEGAYIDLSNVIPTPRAEEIAATTGRDARLCQVYLDESTEVLRVKGRMVITRHRLGFECSSSGVDRSNLAPHGEKRVTLLPRDPDASARQISESIQTKTHVDVAIIINDSFGRHDRFGSIGIAIGIYGIKALEERRQTDLYGNPSNSSIALVDELAAAGSMLMGQADEALPVVIVRGMPYSPDANACIRDLLIHSS